MTMIEKIRQEVERRSYGEQGFNSEDAEYGYRSCARDLLSFLDTLQEKDLDNTPIYFKVPITTHYSDELSYFDPQVTHVVTGEDLCETDKFGDKCACWYVSTIFGCMEDKNWLLHEIAELGYNPTIMDFNKGLFKNMGRAAK